MARCKVPRSLPIGKPVGAKDSVLWKWPRMRKHKPPSTVCMRANSAVATSPSTKLVRKTNEAAVGVAVTAVVAVVVAAAVVTVAAAVAVAAVTVVAMAAVTVMVVDAVAAAVDAVAAAVAAVGVTGAVTVATVVVEIAIN